MGEFILVLIVLMGLIAIYGIFDVFKQINKIKDMKTFNDLVFSPCLNSGVQSRIKFDNGFGASVVRTDFTYGGKDGLYELAVIGKDGNITYDTPITNDVMGYLKEEDVTKILKEIQLLK